MVKNAIKVYGRIRSQQKESRPKNYEIRKVKDHEEITFNTDVSGDYGFYKNTKHKFRFCSVFDGQTTQSEIFDEIAKPVVNSVLEGYNGTIFAYGQTGSGKTYSMTGASEYESRGIIPRTIQHIFDMVKESTSILYSIYISYLEIYNENGYDLLNPRQRATFLEDLPRVSLLEDAKGRTHVRNLGVISVASEREAMCLLFLGDTNRTIAETPMNMYSTRSHCIFTVYVTATITEDGRVRRSKLHLVDLAGSERIQKTGISGNLLVDAKQINLSLHYLEQVIIALSDEKRIHVPYRNSMMTSMLKDSLGGNCLTVMLATLSVNSRNFEETISTCKFAQRVALVSSEAHINEEEDPEVQITHLKSEIENLKKELLIFKKPNDMQMPTKEDIILTPEQIKECERQVKEYVTSPADNFTAIEAYDTRIKTYFKIFKGIIQNQMDTIKISTEHKEARKTMSQIIKQKDNEISLLSKMLSREKLKSRESERPPSKPEPKSPEEPASIKRAPDEREIENFSPMNCGGDYKESKAFEMFMRQDCNKVELNKCSQTLKQKVAHAQTVADTIKMCKNNIVSLKRQLRDNLNNNPMITNSLIVQLKSQQEIYIENIALLRNLKSETDHLNHAFQQEKMRLIQRFKSWWRDQNTSYTLPNKQGDGNSHKTNVNMFGDEFPTQNRISKNFVKQFNSNCHLMDTFPSIYDNTNYLQHFEDINTSLNHSVSHSFMDASKNSPTYNYSPNSNFQPQNPPNYLNYAGSSKEHHELSPRRPKSSSKYTPPSDFTPMTQIINQYSGQPNNIHYQYSISPNDPSNYRNYTEEIPKYVDRLPEKLTPQNSPKANRREQTSLFNYNPNDKQSSDPVRQEDLNQNTSMAPNPEQSSQDKAPSLNFLKYIPLTGDSEVDQEILAFYRAKHNIINNGK